jgi:hypothetical protein
MRTKRELLKLKMKEYSNLTTLCSTLIINNLEGNYWLILKNKDNRNYKLRILFLSQEVTIPKRELPKNRSNRLKKMPRKQAKALKMKMHLKLVNGQLLLFLEQSLPIAA